MAKVLGGDRGGGTRLGLAGLRNWHSLRTFGRAFGEKTSKRTFATSAGLAAGLMVSSSIWVYCDFNSTDQSEVGVEETLEENLLTQSRKIKVSQISLQ